MPVPQELLHHKPSRVEVVQPTPASVTRRVVAWLVDYAIVMIPALALVALAVSFLPGGLRGLVGGVTAGVGWAQLIKLGTPGTGEATWGAVGALLAIPLVQFGYLVTLLAWRGRTIGNVVTRVRFGLAGPGAPRLKGRRVFRRAFSTTVVETGLVSAALALAVTGKFFLGTVVLAAAVAAFWTNALAVLGQRRRTVIDRLCGTVVVRRRTRVGVEVSDEAVELALKATQLTLEASQRSAAQAGSLGGKMLRAADVAVVPGQLALESAPAADQALPVAGGVGQARQLGQAWRDRMAKKNPD